MITPPLTVKKLFTEHHENLDLTWLQGESFETAPFRREPQEFNALVGYLNFIHPHQVTVLGEQEINYLAKLEINAYTDSIQQLFSSRPVLIIIADNQIPSSEIMALANSTQTPLMHAKVPAQRVVDHLVHYLTTQLAATITLHGVFMEVFDLGVILTGKSGIGKSELALELINRGQRLIADDAPYFSQLSPNTLTGFADPIIQDFLEVRGLGLLNIRAMFGHTAIKDRKQLHLIVRIVNDAQHNHSPPIDRLSELNRTCDILNTAIPEVTLPAAPGRSLAILVEAAVRNQILKQNGYDATHAFQIRQQQAMDLQTL